MRVLHILDHSIPLRSGYASRTQAILREQRALGWETMQLTGPKQGPVPGTEEQVDGWEFHRTPPPGGLLEGVPVLEEVELMGEITYRIDKIVRRMRPHILHAHSPVLNAIPALRVGKRQDTAVVYEVRAFWEDAAVARGTVREGGLRYRLIRGLESWALRRADAITTVSAGMRDDIVARGISLDRVTVIPDAADPAPADSPDPALKRQLGLGAGLVLGCTAPLQACTGGDLLLRALPTILTHEASVRVLLVGEGPQEAQLRQLAAGLGVSEKVVFSTDLTEGEKARCLALIDLLVFPDRSTRLAELVAPDGLGDAMARGKVVVASDTGGNREFIRHGQTGVLFKPGDAGALADALTGLLESPQRWPLLQASARGLVEEERNWTRSVAGYADVYARVLGPMRPQ